MPSSLAPRQCFFGLVLTSFLSTNLSDPTKMRASLPSDTRALAYVLLNIPVNLLLAASFPVSGHRIPTRKPHVSLHAWFR